jgi:hypothetical protein
VPSRAIRMSLSPQWVGFHFSTGGNRFSATARATSVSDMVVRSGGASIGIVTI